MADSFTPNLNLRKPEVGAAYDTWGGVAGLNADLDLLDAVFLATGLGTSVGLHVGTGKVLNVEGSMQLADSTDTTKRVVFTAGQVPTATVVELKAPAVGGTIATVEVVTQSHPVGTVLSGYYGTAPAGFVMVDGRTIGDVTSAATNRANDDCQRLFLHLWGLGFTVVGGRGATAAADWAAHRQLTLPDHSGRTMAGRDNLSGTARGVLSGFTAIGVAGGAQNNSASVSASGGGTGAGSASVNGTTSGPSAPNIGSANGPQGTSTDGHVHNISFDAPVSVGVSVSVSGGTSAFSIVQPTIAVDVIMAL